MVATGLSRRTPQGIGACLLMSVLAVRSFAQIEVPTRDQIPDKYKWDLTTIYGDVAAWEKDFQRCQGMIADLRQRQGTLGRSPAALLETLSLRGETRGLVDKLTVYAGQLSDENTADNAALALKIRATHLGVEYSQAVSWFEPELLAMAGNLAAAPGEIFNVLSNAELIWPMVRDESGQGCHLWAELCVRSWP